MKKISAVCAVAIASLSLIGCNNNEGNTAMTQETTYTASEENVKALGRTYFDNDILYCALSGTGAEFSFTGTKCSVVIRGDSSSTNPSMKDNHARVGIYVDGERVVDDMINEAEKSYDVFECQEAKEVTVSIVKLSESPMSTIGIKEIKATGTKIEPTPDKDMLIEFIGDSITCGYGIDDPDKDHHFVTATEDVTKAYAYLTAKALGADYSMVSFSGYGIISGYTTGDEKVSSQTVPQYYTKLGFCWGSTTPFNPSVVEWDFSKRQPDVIVLNLGTNDDSYTNGDAEKQTEYSEAYTEFLKLIREKNPDAKILCAFGIMTDRLFPSIQQAVDNYINETGDTNISTLKFDVQSAADGYSADWHPSVTTQQKAADKITEEIKSILGK